MQPGVKTHKDKKLEDIQQKKNSVFLPFYLLVSYLITPVLAVTFVSAFDMLIQRWRVNKN